MGSCSSSCRNDSFFCQSIKSPKTIVLGNGFESSRPCLVHKKLISENSSLTSFNYRVVKTLGEGITGTVLQIEDKRGVQKAMKKINMNKFDKAQVYELRKEISLLQKLDHPNIVRLVEVYQIERSKDVRLIMDLCTGGDLSSLQAAPKLKTPDQICFVIYQLLSAVNYLHENGIAHRDIKKQNIMFVSQDSMNIQLIDFGLSHLIEKNTNKNGENRPDQERLFQTQCGTCQYMSPQVLDGKYGKECDIWSVGVLTYNLFTKRYPFQSPSQIKNQLLDFKTNSSIWKQNPLAKNLVEQMLTKDIHIRCTAKQALQHSWFHKIKTLSSSSSSDDEVNLELVENCLEKYSEYGTMKKMALLVLAHYYSDGKGLNQLRNAFFQLDTNQNGTVGFEELKTFLMKHCSSKEIAEKMYSKIGFCGEVQYSEFLAATLELVTSVDKEKLSESFDYLSKGQDFITKEHLEKFLGQFVDKRQIDDILSVTDTNHDGKISKEEFLDFVVEKKDVPKLIELVRMISEPSMNKSNMSNTPEDIAMV